MVEESYEKMTLPKLRTQAEKMGIALPAHIKKADLIQLLRSPTGEPSAEPPRQKRKYTRRTPPPAASQPTQEETPAQPEPEPEKPEAVTPPPTPTPEIPAEQPRPIHSEYTARPQTETVRREPSYPPRERTYRPQTQDYNTDARRPARSINPSIPQMLESDDCGVARGVLDIQDDGYGFLRAIDPNQKDVYVSIAQIRRFSLRNGDLVEGRTRPERENERYLAMLYISTINGLSPEESAKRPQFENLTPIYPNRRLRLEEPQAKTDLAIRLLDLVAPIGYGQRGLIVSPPKAGKTTLIKEIAAAVAANIPQPELIVLLIDERPEEVTDMMRSVKGDVYYSTFDQDSAHHIQVAEQTLEKARRSVEKGKDVVLLLDSLTRLARASNLTCTPSGRLLSGGLDPAALAMPKRFFGSARCVEEGGSLTILATALVDTGSRLDDIIYEEFKGTGNMELHLDRKLQERRVFPAMDLYKSGTRHEEKLLTPDELSGIWKVRKLLSGNPDDATELLIDMMAKTTNNTEFLARLESWLSMMDARTPSGRNSR